MRCTAQDTGGEVGGLAEKLIQIGRTSQQRHVGFQRSTPSSEKAPFSRSPSLHVLSGSSVRVSEGSLKVIPFKLFVPRLIRRVQRTPRSEPPVRTEDARSCTGSAAQNG